MCFELELRKFYKMNYEELQQRTQRFIDNVELTHALLGLTGEVGEVTDIIKKYLAYGKAVDRTKLLEELGDVMHYLCRVIDLTGFSAYDVEANNLAKLNKRFANGYTNKDAIAQSEREIKPL